MGLRDVIAKWFGISPVERPMNITIREGTTRELTILKNQLWYRGDPVELEQYYGQLASVSLDGASSIPSTRFWAASPADSKLIRKFHSGLPRLVVDKLAGIVVEDMQDPEMDGGSLQRWMALAEEHDFKEILRDAVVKALSEGDGAFKVCVDNTVSSLPLVEFFSGNDVEFEYKRGKLVEIMFFTQYTLENKRYKLVEHYGKGYVTYELLNDNGKVVDLDTLEETANLKPVSFSGDYIMGVPLKFYRSAKFPDRGESIFEGKGDYFDALDECLSTWLDAVRAGRVKQYIPEALVPRNTYDGSPQAPDVFNQFIIKNTNMKELTEEKIEVVQGDVKFEGLLSSYVTLLDGCLQGLISPSTLGIDVKKLDNAESQREKEKTTMYTRDGLIGVLSKVLPKLVDIVLKTQDTMAGITAAEYKATFEWGQYANPSFEAMVETIGKARQYKIMSIEQCVEELYGDTMDQEDKDEEIARLKSEGDTMVDEPGVNDIFTKGNTGEKDNVTAGGEDNGAEL